MIRITLLTFILLISSLSAVAQQKYFPPSGLEWESKRPSELGMSNSLIDEAVKMAQDNENSVEVDLRLAILRSFGREPYHGLAGPTRHRGGPAGMVIKDGYVIAQWGEIHRADMTFSVTKSYLSTVAGLAYDDKLIRNLNDRISSYVWDATFDGEHNGKVTWEHLLTQTSDWSGTLFGIHDWTDRPPRQGGFDDWRYRELREPGTFYQYNDVRVNVLAYSLLHVFRKPLPMVLKERIMDPIGASTTWRWFGYDGSNVWIDGLEMQSVSGGGHHGGGLFISTADHARFGLLFVRRGEWKGRRLLSQEWIDKAVQPSQPNPEYAYMWWTLKGNTKWPNVPDHVYYASGFGGNHIVIDEKNDLVVVLRWIAGPSLPAFMTKVYESIGQRR